MTSRKSSGSKRVDSGVEPTRSQNITVSWRRSASAGAGASRDTQKLKVLSVSVGASIGVDDPRRRA
jgi:hypothetical protein